RLLLEGKPAPILVVQQILPQPPVHQRAQGIAGGGGQPHQRRHVALGQQGHEHDFGIEGENGGRGQGGQKQRQVSHDGRGQSSSRMNSSRRAASLTATTAGWRRRRSVEMAKKRSRTCGLWPMVSTAYWRRISGAITLGAIKAPTPAWPKAAISALSSNSPAIRGRISC